MSNNRNAKMKRIFGWGLFALGFLLMCMSAASPLGALFYSPTSLLEHLLVVIVIGVELVGAFYAIAFSNRLLYGYGLWPFLK